MVQLLYFQAMAVLVHYGYILMLGCESLAVEFNCRALNINYMDRLLLDEVPLCEKVKKSGECKTIWSGDPRAPI